MTVTTAPNMASTATHVTSTAPHVASAATNVTSTATNVTSAASISKSLDLEATRRLYKRTEVVLEDIYLPSVHVTDKNTEK